MNRRFYVALIAGLSASWANASIVNESLYIMADSLETVDGNTLPYKTFNQEPVFTQTNPVLELEVGDTLDLWVYNLDTVVHEFTLTNSPSDTVIQPGDSVFVQKVFENMGVYIYYDPMTQPLNVAMGLGGMIVVRDESLAGFFWNIKEHDSTWNVQFSMGQLVDPSTYDPGYFTINGNSNPDINSDPTARIVGQVGDTLMLFVANTGQSAHSIHFHGYHATIVFSSHNANHLGREKDTFPIYPQEALTLRLVPDKPGEYPVHDHNLVAVMADNVYPNGMFSTILISP